VGHSGGELVYTHGAASAYVNPGPGGADQATTESSPTAARKDDDH
jgi:hypothetical protein